MYNIEIIHESLVNGQRKQFVDQVDEYGTYDFWEDYSDFLNASCTLTPYMWFRDAVISYFRIKGR